MKEEARRKWRRQRITKARGRTTEQRKKARGRTTEQTLAAGGAAKLVGIYTGLFIIVSIIVGSPFHSFYQVLPLAGIIGFLVYYTKKPLVNAATVEDILKENDEEDARVEKEKAAERARRKVDLTVTVVSATGIAAKDMGGTSDPYVVVKFGGQTFKTKTKKETLDPVWEESFTAFCPDFSRVIVQFEMYDKDMVGADDTMGVAKLVLNRGTEFPFSADLVLQEDLRDRMANVSGSMTVRVNAKQVK